MFSEFVKDGEAFTIAEVGQNHQGDLDNALKYIEIFAHEGAHAIKFQTRDNKFLFSEDAYKASYNSENAFAPTYGAHREHLELNKEWLPILKEACHKRNVKFMSTPFDEPSLELLCDVGVDILKIASFDLGNLPLIDKMGKTGIPVVISVGGGDDHHVACSIETLRKYHDDIAVLHCVSEYPCEFDRLGLSKIADLNALYPDLTIGSSDHFNGTLSGPVAYMQGARVFEKHVTMNRSWNGTDHSFALEPDGFRKFARDISRVRHMMPPKPKEELGKEKVFKKLGKSLVAARDIAEGEILNLDNLSGKIFQRQYIAVRDSSQFIGKTAKLAIPKGVPISIDHVS